MFSNLKNIAGQLRTKIGGQSGSSHDDSVFGRLSFSQEGEDLILARIFEEKPSGFYVDVGAHHPQRFSNTYYFYLRGWRGINIDAAPGCMQLFETLRPRDINLEIAVSDSRQTLTYYSFNEPALNSFSKDLAAERDGLRSYKIVGEQRLETRTLAEVLDAHLPAGTEIDFLSIDVEGLDYEVLKSNDWSRFRPRVLLVEDLEVQSLETLDQSRSAALLRGAGYHLTAKTVCTLIFSRKD